MARQPFQRNQAALFHARERRKSLAGVIDLHRTHRISGATALAVANIAAAQFPVRDTLVTFKTAIRILTGTGAGVDEHRGLVFELGDAAIGVALWLNDTEIVAHAGEDLLVNGATATFDNTVELPVGLELDLVLAVRPGDGRIRLYGNGAEIARGQASSLTFGAAGTWAASSPGSFASAFQTSVIPDVTQSGAPSGFELIEPLSVYVGSVPRHFI